MPGSSFRFILRHLWRNKLYSFIKVSGLALAAACALLAALFIRDETSYDRFHENAANIYRVTTTINDGGKNRITGSTGQPQGPAFKAGIPEIVDFTRVWQGIVHNLASANKSLAVDLMFADPALLKIFSFPLLHGDPQSALSGLNSMILSERTALRFFGTTDVLGRTLELEEGSNLKTFSITGVAKDPPAHSSIQFDVIVPFARLQAFFRDDDWLNPYLSTFVLLHPEADRKNVKSKFAWIFRDHAASQLEKLDKPARRYAFGLQPLTRLHLNVFDDNADSFDKGGLFGESLLSYSYVLSAIALLVLLMACVNFLNLGSADALKRTKEISIRKINGATRSHILMQFLNEAAVLCVIAYILAFIMVISALPLFNQLAQKHITLSIVSDADFFAYGLLIMLLCVTGAGLYPAAKLLSFNAVEDLNRNIKIATSSFIGKTLVVIQFSLAVGLIIATLVYYRQMNFISEKDLGYNGSDIIEVSLPPGRADQQHASLFRNELLRVAAVSNTTMASMYAAEKNVLKVNGRTVQVSRFNVDNSFLAVMQIPLKKGRNFQAGSSFDSAGAIIVNETFVREAGWEEAINREISFPLYPEGSIKKTIVGVIKDFHYGTLREQVEPQVLELKNAESAFIRFEKGKTPAALAGIELAFKTTFPDHYFHYSFLEDKIRREYESEHRWKLIIGFAAMIAILICAIGLFGLVHFSTLQRTREIGIRKVLGATAINISLLISKDFLRLVLLALVIACPISWYYMNGWLQNFSYRIDVSWFDFAIGGLLAVFITILTIGVLTIRAALANPVNAIKSE